MQIWLTSSCRLDVNDLGCKIRLSWLAFIVLDDDRDFVVVVLDMLSDVVEVVVVGSEAGGKRIGRNFARLEGVTVRLADCLAMTYDEVLVIMTSVEEKRGNFK